MDAWLEFRLIRAFNVSAPNSMSSRAARKLDNKVNMPN